MLLFCKKPRQTQQVRQGGLMIKALGQVAAEIDGKKPGSVASFSVTVKRRGFYKEKLTGNQSQQS